MPLKVVYIAGPYRADTIRQTVLNIRGAEQLAVDVWLAGGIPLCPHMNSALLDGIVGDAVFLEGNLELLSRCDAVVLHLRWQQSEGTRVEKGYAEERNIPVFERFSSLMKWLSDV